MNLFSVILIVSLGVLLNPYRFGGGISFAPTDVTGCVLWLDGNDTAKLWQDTGASTPVASDGDPVRLWQDKSGSNYHGTAPTDARRATYQTSELNSKAVIRFDGSDDYFDLVNGFSGLTSGEIFIVFKRVVDPATSTGTSGFWMLGSVGASSDHIPYTDGTVYAGFGTDTRKTTVNPATTLAQWNLLNFSSANNNWRFRLNTATEYTNGVNTVGFTTTPKLGKSIGEFYLYGDVAEVILYNKVLNSTERGQVETYLDSKWALPY